MKLTNKREKAFTLMEIMLVLAIFAILVGIAIPEYNKYKLKGNRTQAISAVTEAAQREEQWYSDNGAYTANLGDLDMPAAVPGGQYTLAAAAPTSDEFTITATAISGQQVDSNCRTFSLDQAGRRRSKDSDGNPSTGCWPK